MSIKPDHPGQRRYSRGFTLYRPPLQSDERKKLHEGCIHQMYRLYHDFLFGGSTLKTDAAGRIRLDDREMRADVQDEVTALWEKADTDNFGALADLEGLKQEFLRHHGFGMPGIDYEQDIAPDHI